MKRVIQIFVWKFKNKKVFSILTLWVGISGFILIAGEKKSKLTPP